MRVCLCACVCVSCLFVSVRESALIYIYNCASAKHVLGRSVPLKGRAVQTSVSAPSVTLIRSNCAERAVGKAGDSRRCHYAHGAGVAGEDGQELFVEMAFKLSVSWPLFVPRLFPLSLCPC